MTIQNLPEGIVLQVSNLASRLNSQNYGQETTVMDGQLLSPGCLPTIQRMVTDHQKSNRRKCTDLITKLRPGDNCHEWPAPIPWMFTHHPKDKDGHPVSQGWSSLSLRLVNHYPIAPSQILSPSLPRMVSHNPKRGRPPTPSKITSI